MCCGVSNKGAAIYNGKVFRATLDAHVVAYEAKTGKEIWKEQGRRVEGRLLHNHGTTVGQWRAHHRHVRC